MKSDAAAWAAKAKLRGDTGGEENPSHNIKHINPSQPHWQHNAFDSAKNKCLRPRFAGRSAEMAFHAAARTDLVDPARCEAL
jgi:hypothetical protein